MLIESDADGKMTSLLFTNSEETINMMELATTPRCESYDAGEPIKKFNNNPKHMNYREKPLFFKVIFNKKEPVEGQPDKLTKANVLVEADSPKDALKAVDEMVKEKQIEGELEIEAVLRVGFDGAVATKE